MKAFLGDPQLKVDIVEELRIHRESDAIVKGHYGKTNGKFTGCAIGCSIHSLNQRRGLSLPTNDHGVYETHLGIPRVIARLEDSIFEALPEDRYLDWPWQVASAIQVGSDLSMVWPKFALWLLTDSNMLRITDRNRESIEGVAGLYRKWLDGAKPSIKDWRKARTAAYAAYAAAADAAYAYAAAAAADAADAARRSAIWKTARTAAWCEMADKLLQLLAAA